MQLIFNLTDTDREVYGADHKNNSICMPHNMVTIYANHMINL